MAQTGREREAVIQVANRLCLELGYPEAEGIVGETCGPGVGKPLDIERERLIAAVSQGLSRIAAAAKAGRSEGIPDTVVRALLGGAELVLRREMMMGKAADLKELLPSFVFLVTLPLLEQDKARKLADRTTTLLEEALADQDPADSRVNDLP